jgi:hypothetical protein
LSLWANLSGDLGLFLGQEYADEQWMELATLADAAGNG